MVHDPVEMWRYNGKREKTAIHWGVFSVPREGGELVSLTGARHVTHSRGEVYQELLWPNLTWKCGLSFPGTRNIMLNDDDILWVPPSIYNSVVNIVCHQTQYNPPSQVPPYFQHGVKCNSLSLSFLLSHLPSTTFSPLRNYRETECVSNFMPRL